MFFSGTNRVIISTWTSKTSYSLLNFQLKAISGSNDHLVYATLCEKCKYHVYFFHCFLTAKHYLVHPGFPMGDGASLQKGALTYDFAEFSTKLHEIEKFLLSCAYLCCVYTRKRLAALLINRMHYK